jgi:hypothetical protein
MFKDFLLVKASPQVARDKVQSYLQFNHAPLALSTQAVGSSMQRYTMSHLVDEPSDLICLYPTPPDLVTVVEHKLLGGAEKVHMIMADEEYIEKVVPDEKHMIENLMAGMPQFVAVESEQTIFGQRQQSSKRLFEFLRRLPGVSREDFLARLQEEGDWASADRQYNSAVELRVHSFVGSGPLPVGATEDAPVATEEPFDAVVESWVTQPDILASLSDTITTRRTRYCDTDRSLAALTNENVIRL